MANRDSFGRFVSLGAIGVQLTGDSSSFEKMIASAEGSVLKATQRLEKAGRALTLAVSVPLAGLGAASVKAFAEFEKAMTVSTAIMGDLSMEQRKQLEGTAKQISTETVTSAADLAKAYYFLASAGLDAAASQKALGLVNKFAIAGNFDLEVATSLLADAQSALGLASKDSTKNLENMTRVADVLTQGGIIANASVEQLAKSLTTKAAANMRQLNIDVEEGVAVLAAYAAQGIKGEQAGEKFDIILRELQASVMKNAEAWGQYGLALYDTDGSIRPLVNIIGDLEKLFEPMTHQQRQATAAMLGFRAESFGAIRPLLGMSNQIQEFTDSLYQAGNVTESVAGKQMNNLTDEMTILWNRLTLVRMEIGEALVPVIKFASGIVQEFIDWWGKLSKETKTTLVWIGAFVAVIGPAILAVGLLGSGLASLVGFFSALSLTTVAWAAVIPLIIAALVMVTDGILQLTGTANLGMIDMVNNFRIGGFKIATWMTLAWLAVLGGWEYAVEVIYGAWADLKIGIYDIQQSIWRGAIVNAKAVASAWHTAIYAMTGSDERAAQLADSNKFFDDLLSQSLNDATKKWDEYYSNVMDGEKEKNKVLKTYMDAMNATIAEDADKTASKVAESIPEFVNPNKTAGGGSGMPDVLEQVGKQSKRQQDFEMLNLRQFSIQSLGELNKPEGKEEQKVKAPALERKMDKMIDTLNRGFAGQNTVLDGAVAYLG